MFKQRQKAGVKFTSIDIDALESAVLQTHVSSPSEQVRELEVWEEEIKLQQSEDTEVNEPRHFSISAIKLIGNFSQVIEIAPSMLKRDDEMDIVMTPEKRYIPILSSLASVGIINDNFSVKAEFYPHGRELYLLPSMGEFTFRGETIEEFYFPTIGAEKFGKGTFQSIGVASREGVLAQGVFTDIIDSAREKLDGEEVIVYKIKTRNYECAFKWSSTEHCVLDKPAEPGHYELVDRELFFLSGVNSLMAKRHEWEYLSEALVNRVRSREGLIVRMSGKEYRLPWQHSATLQVIEKSASDLSGTLVVPCDAEDGLYDFVYQSGLNRWDLGKVRKDKNRPDHIAGINDMINRTATLREFLDSVTICKSCSMTPMKVSVVPLSQNLQERVRQLKDVTTVKIRVSGNYKQPDSYRRILVEDLCPKGQVNTMSVVPTRPNIIVSSGRVIMFKRHEGSVAFKIGDKFYSTNSLYGKGNVKYIKLRHVAPFSINIGGPVLRVYEYGEVIGEVMTFDLRGVNIGGAETQVPLARRLSDRKPMRSVEQGIQTIYDRSVGNVISSVTSDDEPFIRRKFESGGFRDQPSEQIRLGRKFAARDGEKKRKL